MIVNDDTVSKALAYLAEDPHPIALARKDVTDAENNVSELYSRLFLAAEGSNDVRKATAFNDPLYAEAKEREAEAIKDFERHRSRVKAAEMICEIWRSEQANVRAAERIR